jgi:hypothetical protein
MAKFHLYPYTKYGIRCTDFHKTFNSPMVLHVNVLKWILPKLVTKYQMHGNSFYVPTKSITVTELTFMALMPVLTKFNENVTNGLVADTGS